MKHTHTVTLLFADDLDAVVAFYDRVLGWSALRSWSPDGRLTWVMLGPDDEQGPRLMYNLPQEAGATVPRGGPRQVVPYVYVDDVDAMHERAKAAGADPGEIEPNFGMREFHVVDPAGYHLYFAQFDD